MRPTPAVRFAAACAGVAGLIGLAGMAGWIFRIPGLVQWVPGTTPMHFNTATLFVAGSAGLLGLVARRPWLARAAATALAAVAAATLAQDALALDLGVQEFGGPAFVPGFTEEPARMAPHTAVAFLLLGSALFLRSARTAPGAVVLLSTLALGAALVPALGYLTRIDTYGWGEQTRMAPNTSLALLLLGTALLATVWRGDAASSLPPWLPIAIAGLALSITVYLWQGLRQQDGAAATLSAMVLLSGTAGAFLLAALTRLWRSNAGQALRLEGAIRELQAEVDRRTKLQEELQSLNRELDLEVQRRSHLAEERRLQAEAANRELDLRVRELGRSNEELERFAYVASHDLQEPLRAIAGFSGLLARRYDSALDERGQEYLRRLVGASVRMQEQIEDLLRYSRVGTQGGQFRRTPAAEAVAKAVENLRAAVDESGARIEVGVLPVVYADPVQLAQVFQNLIGNALKFRKEAPPRVHITSGAVPEGHQFTVADDGIGIEPQFFERIFQLFQRLHTRDAHPGTGIGLALCKKVIDRHGGRIWVESQPGQGSAFHFVLPACPPETP